MYGMKQPLSGFLVLFYGMLTLAGCSYVADFPKTVWGSSTRALESARDEAVKKEYVCSLDDCFAAVLTLNRRDESTIPLTEKFFDVFIKNRIKRHLVVMRIKGNVNTTEVGIFFVRPTRTTVRIEISSLSSSAKEKVSNAVFQELDLRFSEATPADNGPL
jgi:hypothetical protein